MGYIGINGSARKLADIYIGVNGAARKVTKAYVGVNGSARLWWNGNENEEEIDPGLLVEQPTLLPGYTWYKGATDPATIATIEIVKSYTPTGTEAEVWFADKDELGAIKCYVIGSKLIIAGNGKKRIWANPNSSYAFGFFYPNGYTWDTERYPEHPGRSTWDSVLTEINGLTLLNTSYAIDMSNMFYGCGNLLNIGCRDFDTRNVVSMAGMFACCHHTYFTGTSTLPFFQNWITTKLTNCSFMFANNWNNQNSTTYFTLFDTSNVTNMSGMFQFCRWSGFNLEGINTSNVTNMSFMFSNCNNVHAIDVSSFNTSKVEDMRCMFFYSYEIEELDLTSFDLTSCNDLSEMFRSCTALTSVKVSQEGWKIKAQADTSSMFYLSGCSGVTYVE